MIKVSEMFYSLQGEGARAGEPSLFIRLSGCSAKHACFAGGVICDTEFESGSLYDLSKLEQSFTQVIYGLGQVEDHVPQEGLWIVWTGGEPLDQLTPEILSYFKSRGYKQAIETSGIRSLSQEMANLIDHITVSPKVAEHVLLKHFGHLSVKLHFGERSAYDQVMIDELRYVRHAGQPSVPEPALVANYYYLSPHSDGAEINQENLQHCIRLCLENPKWRLSVQQHKLWRVL